MSRFFIIFSTTVNRAGCIQPRLPATALPVNRAVKVAAVDASVRSPTLDSLRELEFVDYEQPPPASIFRSSPTLSFLSIKGCPLHDATAQQGLH
jgi:hypothetical protein